MSKRILLQLFIGVAVLLTGCKDKSTIKMERIVDTQKRDKIVQKYNLLNFSEIKDPVFLTIDEFFDGNNDDASIAPNLDEKRPIKEYYRILKTLSKNPKIIGSFVEIKDVMIYDNGLLHDDEWFYTDIIYFIGDLTKEDIREATESLMPDEVEYDTENRISEIHPEYKGKKIVCMWWD